MVANTKQLITMEEKNILNEKVTFSCISKKVTMTVQELINYYVESEIAAVAEECNF